MNRSTIKEKVLIVGNTGDTFNLNYAARVGTFSHHAGEGFLDQIKFIHDQGFKAIEDSTMMGRSINEQEKIGNLLNKLEMKMGVFVVGRGIGKGLDDALVNGGVNWKPSLATGKQEYKEEFLKTCRKAVETARRCNAKWVTVIPGFYDRSLPIGVQTSNVIDAIKRGVEIFEAHDLVMVLESLSDTPDLFLQHTDQSYLVCKAVNSPSCKILYDIYHMSRNEGNLITTMDKCWDEIAYIQIGDNPGRNEPSTGEINYRNVFKFIHSKGYDGILGMEHGNSKKGKEGEVALLKAYRDADNFI